MKQAVAGIVFVNGKILIGKKIKKKDHFLSEGWHIPGGHLLEGEDEETGLIREFKEETSLNINIISKVAIKEIPENDVEVHWYIGKATKTINYVPGDDLSEIKLVCKDKVIEACDIRTTQFWPEEVLKYLRE